MAHPQRLLLIRRGGLGDTLLVAPLLRALARAHPGAPIDVAGVLEFARVLASCGAAARALSSEDTAAWLRRDPARFAGYALVVADDPRYRAAAAHGPRVQVFDPAPRAAQPLPVQLAEQLGLQLVWPGDAALAGPAARSSAGPIVLAPGSGGRAKCWPRPGWLELAAQLAVARRDVAVLVGPVEVERDDPRRWPWPRPVAFVVDADLCVVAERLRAAAAFVGNDSGTTHLAAMLGVPTVALFGPSDAVVFGPTGPRVAVVRAPGGDLAALAAGAVLAALFDVQGSRARTRSQ